jgi:hypothetical protein
LRKSGTKSETQPSCEAKIVKISAVTFKALSDLLSAIFLPAVLTASLVVVMLSNRAHADVPHAPFISCVEFGPTAYLIPQSEVEKQSYVSQVLAQFHDVKRAVFARLDHPAGAAQIDLVNLQGETIALLLLSADRTAVEVIQAKVKFPKYQVSSEFSSGLNIGYGGTLYFTLNDQGDIATFALSFFAPSVDGSCQASR